MIEEIYNHLLLFDEFSSLSPHEIHVEPLQTLAHSEVYRIRIDAPPTSLILKRPGASDMAGLAERERRFYRHIAPLLPSWLVPNCVLAVEGDQSGWLLIEDLSTTHHAARNPSEPTRQECRCFVEALATLHALTSSSSAIQGQWTKISPELPAGTIEQRLGFFLTALEPFIVMLRDRVDPKVENFLSGLGELNRLIHHGASRTTALVHGDAHFANALYSSAPRACLIDWGMPMVGFGEIDLAHALALNLPRHLGRKWEAEMTHVYLDQMAACGSFLDTETFYERYRLGVLYSFVSPVVWWRSGVPETLWWPALNNSLDAARDLGLIK